MRKRVLLIVLAVVLLSSCGTTGDDDASGDGEKSTTTAEAGKTSTTTDSTDPDASDTTEPDDGGPLGTIDEEDLERVLPAVEDLPEGWSEVPVPEDDGAETEYEPSVGCEAVAEWLGRDIEDEKAFVERSFEGPNGFAVNISVTNAPEELKPLFADIGSQSEGCEQIRATSDDGYAATAFMSPGTIDLGDDAFYIEMHVEADDVNFPPTGITLVGVVHGDVTYRVQLVDGRDEADNRVTRDPQLAQQIATKMDENLDILLGD